MTQYDIGHEDGDFREYTSTVTNGGDLSVSSAAGLAGTGYGLSLLVNDSTTMYARKVITATDEIRLRLYIDLNTLSISSGSYLCMMWLANAAGSDRYIVYLLPGRVIKLFAITDDDDWTNVGTGTLSTGENYVEFSFRAGSGSGIARMWINGTLACENTSIDNDTYSDDVSQLYFGKTDLFDTVSGAFYLDAIVITDDYATTIGPVSGGSVVVPVMAHLHKMMRA